MTDVKVGDTVQLTRQVVGVVTEVDRSFIRLEDNGWYSTKAYGELSQVETKVLKRATPPKPTVVGTLVRYTTSSGVEFLYSLHKLGHLCCLVRGGSTTWEGLINGAGTTEIVHVPGESND